MVLGTCFVNYFVEYLPVLFSSSGAREQRVCLRMGRVDHKLSRELLEGESDSTPSLFCDLEVNLRYCIKKALPYLF